MIFLQGMMVVVVIVVGFVSLELWRHCQMLKIIQNYHYKKYIVILLEIQAAFVWFKYAKEDLEIFKMHALFVIFWAHWSVNQRFAKFGKILVWISDQVVQKKLVFILKPWNVKFWD